MNRLIAVDTILYQLTDQRRYQRVGNYNCFAYHIFINYGFQRCVFTFQQIHNDEFILVVRLNGNNMSPELQEVFGNVDLTGTRVVIFP